MLALNLKPAQNKLNCVHESAVMGVPMKLRLQDVVALMDQPMRRMQ